MEKGTDVGSGRDKTYVRGHNIVHLKWCHYYAKRFE